MATENHVVIANIAPLGTTALGNCPWYLTRAMKKAGWKYIAAGNGSVKDTSRDPELDPWQPWAAPSLIRSGTGASIAAPTLGRATITGLTGVVAADKGRFLKISGAATSANNHYHQIEEILSSTSVRIDARNFAVAADANNGVLDWEVRDPTADNYLVLDSIASWTLYEGPRTYKIPITADPVAGPGGFKFIRGENIVQTTTGAEGEILGYVYDSGTGYLVVAPRIRGTGSGVYGFQTGNVLTGSISGSTVSQNGTALEYVHEFVVWKAANTTTGSMYHGVFDSVADASDRFSASAKLTTASATVAPGTSGDFPAYGWVQWGSNATGTHVTWQSRTSQLGTQGNSQFIAADLIEEPNYSADGSWFWLTSTITTTTNPSNFTVGSYDGFGFMRLDDTEEGDLDPYLSLSKGSTQTLYGNQRTGAGSGTNDSQFNGDMFNTIGMGTGPGTDYTYWRGWRRRGLSNELFQTFEICQLFTRQSGGAMLTGNPTDSMKSATSLVPTRVREPVWVASIQLNRKMVKGTCRWLHFAGGGGPNDMYDNGKWLQLSGTIQPMVCGPWNNTQALSS